MTNTIQTYLLDGVEPDCWRYETVRGTYRYRGPCINFDKDYNSLKPVGLLTFKRVEALLEANRKQVLLEAAEKLNTPLLGNEPAGFAWTRRHILSELRRMALDDKGEKNEEG
jgi:hypothetical protein